MKNFFSYIIIFFLLFSLTSCTSTSDHSSNIKSYINVKQRYVDEISKSWSKSDHYKLVMIPPLAELYDPGMPLAKDSLEPLTDSCEIPNKLIEKKPVNLLPLSRSDKTFDASISMPSMLKSATKYIADFNVSINKNNISTLSYTNLGTVNPRSDVVKMSINNYECLNQIAGKEVVYIRGHVSAKELIKSEKQLSGSAKIEFLKNDALQLKYDNSGGYELIDKEPTPKFWIVSEIKVEIPNLSSNDSPQLRKQKIMDFVRMESPISLTLIENEPTQETIKMLNEKYNE